MSCYVSRFLSKSLKAYLLLCKFFIKSKKSYSSYLNKDYLKRIFPGYNESNCYKTMKIELLSLGIVITKQ